MQDVCLLHYKQSNLPLRNLLSIPGEDSYCSKKIKSQIRIYTSHGSVFSNIVRYSSQGTYGGPWD